MYLIWNCFNRAAILCQYNHIVIVRYKAINKGRDIELNIYKKSKDNRKIDALQAVNVNASVNRCMASGLNRSTASRRFNHGTFITGKDDDTYLRDAVITIRSIVL